MSSFTCSGQFVLSRTNHHLHLPDSKTGVRMPLNACIAKGHAKKKVKECKHGAPWTKQCTSTTKVVCHGVAKRHCLKAPDFFRLDWEEWTQQMQAPNKKQHPYPPVREAHVYD